MSRFDDSDNEIQTEVVVPALFQAQLRAIQTEASPISLGRYQSICVLGRGGMGEVWKAHDPRMGRDLALKVLLADVARSPDAAARFVDEARIAAKLQHPNVVPIYEVDHLDDGRPYFTMKLVTGRTLAEILTSLTTTDRDQLLQIFEKICQAVAYAHSEGVIHRDLKPSNVMVGAFGEVQVMDWGIAKLLHQDEPESIKEPDDTATTPSPSTDSSRTRAGTVMGTFAYMPPEQARGEISDLDERADVFALGAILCELLTGSPPYKGDSGEAMRALAVQGDLTVSARHLRESGADSELVQLAKACLAPKKEDRPRDARSVAEAITAYRTSLAERLQVEKYARVASRHRLRLTLALAASLVVLAGSLAVGVIRWRDEESQRSQKLALVRANAEDVLEEVDQQLAVGAWKDAGHSLDEAKLVLHPIEASKVQDLSGRVSESGRLLSTAKALDRIRLDRSVSRDETVSHQFSDAYQKEFEAAGVDVLRGDLNELEQVLRRSPIRTQFLGALDDWTVVTFSLGTKYGTALRDRLLALAQGVDPESNLRRALTSPGILNDRAALSKLAESNSEEVVRSPALCLLVTQLLEQVNADPIPLLMAALEERPNDFWLNFETGSTLISAKHPESAIGYLRAAVVLRPDSSAVWGNLGVALISAGQLPEALKVCRWAVKMSPESPILHINLGKALSRSGDREAALACYQEAVRLNPNLNYAQYNLAVILEELGRDEEAIAAYRRAIRGQKPVSMGCYNLGALLERLERIEEAQVVYQQGADSAGWKSCYSLGRLLEAKGDLNGAISAYKKLNELQPEFAAGHGALGRALLFSGRFDEAGIASRKALELLPKDSPNREPALWQIRTAEEMAKVNLHLEEIRSGAAPPTDVRELLDLAELCRRYRKEYDAAVDFYERAFAIEPDAAESRSGALRFRAARTAVLAEQFEKALVWLRADLGAWRTYLESDDIDRDRIRGGVGWWLQEPDLITVREPEKLQELPEAQRHAWCQFWLDVQNLLAELKQAG